MRRYRCQLARLGAPHWACGLLGIFFALVIIGYVVFISASLWDNPHTSHWTLLWVWGLGALGVALAGRSSRAAFRPDSGAGPAGSGTPAPSNNRSSGP